MNHNSLFKRDNVFYRVRNQGMSYAFSLS
jgi:hypothetical protein